jgi:hypothetical protein
MLHGNALLHVPLGMNSVYAGRNDQSQGGYGGVERVELRAGNLRVVLVGELAHRMRDREFQIAFALPP